MALASTVGMLVPFLYHVNFGESQAYMAMVA